MIRNQQGQVSAELAILFAFVIAGFLFMGFYLQRAAQGSTKSNTDAIGSQFSTLSEFNSQSTSRSFEQDSAAPGTPTTVTTHSCTQYDHALDPATPAATLADCDPSLTGEGATGTILE